jgi:hypothetical protein
MYRIFNFKPEIVPELLEYEVGLPTAVSQCLALDEDQSKSWKRSITTGPLALH